MKGKIMAYFNIMAELRGAYSDNESMQVIRCNTRRDLKSAIESEAYYLRDAGAIGLNKRAIAWLANAAWKARKGGAIYPYVAPFRYPYQSGEPMGIMVSSATRADFIDFINNCE